MRRAALGAALIAVLLPHAPASAGWPPQVARGITLPVGFVARVFANSNGSLPTSLAWGATTVSGAQGRRLYVTAVDGVAVGNGFQAISAGSLLAFGEMGGPGTVVASGLDQPLGVVMGPDKTLYVSENKDPDAVGGEDGPLGARGRITALRDDDGDGIFETKRTVIKNLPNGRHQTNGMAFGPDGKLYVANGNATDDGIECGPPLIIEIEPPPPPPLRDIYDRLRSVECHDEAELKPWSGSIIRVDTSWSDVDLLADIRVDNDPFYAADGRDDESVLVSPGYRNIYDVDFDPRDPTRVWTPMNGPDDPSGSEPLYSIDTANEQIVGTDADGNPIYGPVIEDAGFPSCLYDPHGNPFPKPNIGGHTHAGIPDPQDNLNPDVLAKFGPCDRDAVIRPKAIFAEGHEGTSGLAFERGDEFPGRYDGDLFAAEWGSLWNLNGGEVTGHKIIHLDISAEGKVERQREFMSGVLPMDVTFGANGAMYMADMSGQIYEVTYEQTLEQPTVVNVDMRAGQFVPQAVTVLTGQTVRWHNADSGAHTISAVAKIDPTKSPIPPPIGEGSLTAPLQTGSEINSPGNIQPGESYSFTFPEPGIYHYRSTANAVDEAAMRGTIIVLPVSR